MRRMLFVTIVLCLGISVAANAQMKLAIANDFAYEQPATLGNHNLESNLNLDLPTKVTAPGNMKNFYKGMIILGVLADLTIPFGDENEGFKHIASTAFSVHAMAAYVVANSIFLAIRAGFISFGTKTTEGSQGEFSYKYEDSYSQIPILFGAYYLFAMQSAFRPYIGLALGIFFQSYKVNWQESYGGFFEPFSLEKTFTSTAFGLVPTLGFFYILGSMMLHVCIDYAFIFSNLPTAEYDGQSEETSEKAKYLSFVLGIMFPLGSK